MGEETDGVNTTLDISKGSMINKFEQATDRFGHMISTGKDTEEAMSNVADAAHKFLQTMRFSDGSR